MSNASERIVFRYRATLFDISATLRSRTAGPFACRSTKNIHFYGSISRRKMYWDADNSIGLSDGRDVHSIR